MIRYKSLVVSLALSCVVSTGCSAEPLSDTTPTLTLPSQNSTGLLGHLSRYMSTWTGVKDPEAEKELKTWQGINSEVSAIIEIKDFNVREPVLSPTIDNKQWLRTNIYGEPDINGCVFFDYRSTALDTPIRMVHGHNMANGTVFGRLPELLGLQDISGAPLVRLYENGVWSTYKVFSVLSIDATKEAFPIDALITYAEIEAIAQDLLDRSVVSGGSIESWDILVLNTCWYGETGDQRNLHCIVSASRI